MNERLLDIPEQIKQEFKMRYLPMVFSALLYSQILAGQNPIEASSSNLGDTKVDTSPLPDPNLKTEEVQGVLLPRLNIGLPESCRLTSNNWTGTASYYTWSGCLGCNRNRIMANGEQLNDNIRTLAFMRAPLNSTVLIENLSTGSQTVARVTDRGGFEARGWIADLSLATRNAIGGGSLTEVNIRLLDCR